MKEDLMRSRASKQWEKIGIHDHHGICVPLWALHSQKSCGIGDFNDLYPLIDWCTTIGMDCIQLLPLTDSGDDPSPYNSLSTCALNPIYLNLSDLPNSDVKPAHFALYTKHPRLPYNAVRREKLFWLFHYYERAFSEIKESQDYRLFLEQNASWLEDYSLFMANKDEYGGKSWTEWPPEKRSKKACSADFRAIDFHRFLQFHCARQLKAVKAYAEQKGVLLKGDIPILLSPDSADVWAQPHLFNFEYGAGAPPDYFNPDGQHWGFPLLSWDAMRNENNEWWKRRIGVASQYYHLYRIDHFAGLFRLWGFPKQDPQAEGHFIPQDDSLWEMQGRSILESIVPNSEMLPMGEDLGILPPNTKKIMHEFGICGMSVIRWQRDHDHKGDFIPYDQYDPLSMTSVSTHDAEPLGLWWRDLPKEAARFAEFKRWTYEPELAPWQRKEILHDSHQTPTFFHMSLLQEYLAMFPCLVSSNPEEERINVPGTVLPSNWTYRFKPSLEEILSHKELEREMKDLLNRSK